VAVRAVHRKPDDVGRRSHSTTTAGHVASRSYGPLVTQPQPQPQPIARLLASALEPIAGQAQFVPDCHANYVALGFAPSPGMAGMTALPDKASYFASRSAVMGDVGPELVAAAFAMLNPDVIVPLAKRGQELADAATMWRARLDGAAAQLRRILGPEPVGAAWVTEPLLRAADDLPLSGPVVLPCRWRLPHPVGAFHVHRPVTTPAAARGCHVT
jgi:Helix-turn-helix family